MALDQSALLEVLYALKVADVGYRVRRAVETIYQALIEAEPTEAIGAARAVGGADCAAQRSPSRGVVDDGVARLPSRNHFAS